MIRARSRRVGRFSARLLAALTVVSLLALSIGPSFLLAANTRDIYFGTPESEDGAGGNGALDFSAVTTGGRTVVQLLIRNDGNQTINHIKFAAGAAADILPYNDSYPRPAGESLDGASIAAVFPSTGCDPSSGASLMCDVGSLSAGDFRLYTIVITPPSQDTYDIWLTVSWNEGWSTTGSNADYTFAQGSFTVETAGCATPASSYFLPGEAVSLTNPCNEQNAAVSTGELPDFRGLGSVGIDDGIAVTCPDGYACEGNTVAVTIGDGSAVPNGVQWTVKWFGIKSLKGVIHFHDNYDPDDPTTYTVIPFMKKFQCSDKLTTNCWVSTESSKGNADPWWFEAVFVTPNNGRAGGFI